MFVIIGLMLTGMLLGYLMRNKQLLWIYKVVTLFIWVLLFLLGVNIGSDEKVIKGLYTLGVEAIIITLAALIGSIVAAWALWRILYKNRRKAQR